MRRKSFRDRPQREEKKRVKFDVMLDGRFIKTFTMAYSGNYIDEEKVRAFVEKEMPVTLKGKDYQVCF